jgi:hypothetical protein
MPKHVPDFDRIFRDGARFVWPGDREAQVAVVPAGDLIMPSGRLVACDPFLGLVFDEDAVPFTVQVPPGRYPVLLALVGWTDPEKPLQAVTAHRTAAAKLAVSDEPVVRWELALVAGQSLADLGENEFYGYGVDAGTGCFIDASAVQALKPLVQDDDDDLVELSLTDALSAVDWVGAVDLPSLNGEVNIIAFMSGPGDGAYPTWVGYDAADHPTCFITDFEYLRRAEPAPQ